MQRGRALIVTTVLVVGLVASCGGDSADPAPDPADATSCGDLADKFVEITAEVIDQIGDRTDAEMESPSAEDEAAGDEWSAVFAELLPRTAELCTDGEFDELLCGLEAEIQPAGEAAERFMQDNFPACSS